MRYLRTNTATRVTVGPFIGTDGLTPKTSLTVTNCKLTMSVDDGGVPTLVLDTNPTASGGSNDMVHITGDDAGFYDLELAAANVNYVGRAILSLQDSANHAPVFHEFMILPAKVYDSLMLGTDNLEVDLIQVNGSTSHVTKLIAALRMLSLESGTLQSGSTTEAVLANGGGVAVKAHETWIGFLRADGTFECATIAGITDPGGSAPTISFEDLATLDNAVDGTTEYFIGAMPRGPDLQTPVNALPAATATAVADLTGSEPAGPPDADATWLEKLDYLLHNLIAKQTLDKSDLTDIAWKLRNLADDADIASRSDSVVGDTITKGAVS